MIKKPQVKQQASGVKVIKNKLDKQDFNFDFCLKELQKQYPDAQFACHEDFIIEQEQVMKRMFSLLENKIIAEYLLKKFKNSRFKTFKMAMKVFIEKIEGYMNGSIDIESVVSYQDNITSIYGYGEYWYDQFNLFRSNFIDGLRNKNREKNFTSCIKILVEAGSPNSPEENHNYLVFLEDTVKLNRVYMIDLMELCWPERGGTLKLLFGET